MLEAFLIGLITNGIYYLAQRNQGSFRQTQATKALSKEEIRNSLENGLKSLFPQLTKEFPELVEINGEQVRCLQKLFYRADGELTDRLRQTITESIDGLSSYKRAGEESIVDMFSVEGFERTLIELIKVKGLKGLKAETVSFAVPRLYFRMLQEISNHPAVSEVVKQIRECQKARLQREVFQKLSEVEKYHKLDDEMILTAVNTARQRLKVQATRQYDIKMAGGEPDGRNRFEYMPPRMWRVFKGKDGIPEDFEEQTKPIHSEGFHKLFLKKRKVLVIAGAGIGKTTFLLRLQLELMQKRITEIPLPVFGNVSEFVSNSGTLFDRMISLLQKTSAINFSSEKASRVAGVLNENGQLCFLLDSLDQCHDVGICKNCFQMDSVGIFEQNRVVVASRIEHINRDRKVFRDIFSTYEWIILGRFSLANLIDYLGPKILDKWLDYAKLSKNFLELLRTPFYANITKRIGLRPEADRKPVENRMQLLAEYEVELFREARLRKGIIIHELDEPKIKDLLYRLSLDTLTEGEIQIFPFGFLKRYQKDHQDACRIIFDTHWVSFFSKTLFEGKDETLCTFYHQLLQEYFAARRLKQLFENDRKGFDDALIFLPFSPVVLDFVDELLPHEQVFNHCMDQFEKELARADQDKQGITDSGQKFTWLLALRDLKGERPGLKERLQEIFDAEKERSKIEIVTDGKFVQIPAGAFLMGSYKYDEEMPVQIVYVSEYWISKYAETFREYDEYCLAQDKEKHKDNDWGRGERPVIRVEWSEAQQYALWRGKEYSLPSEAQWEKAARGRLGRNYPWGNCEPDRNICNFHYNYNKTIEVHKFEPQMYGIHQIAGNVLEWVEDRWHRTHDGSPINGSAWVIDGERGSYRVARGGGWPFSARYCRSAFRYRQADFRFDFLGFRLSRSVAIHP